MKTFIVEVIETNSKLLEIKARNEKDALARAKRLVDDELVIMTEDVDSTTEYRIACIKTENT